MYIQRKHWSLAVCGSNWNGSFSGDRPNLPFSDLLFTSIYLIFHQFTSFILQQLFWTRSLHLYVLLLQLCLCLLHLIVSLQEKSSSMPVSLIVQRKKLLRKWVEIFLTNIISDLPSPPRPIHCTGGWVQSLKLTYFQSCNMISLKLVYSLCT